MQNHNFHTAQAQPFAAMQLYGRGSDRYLASKYPPHVLLRVAKLRGVLPVDVQRHAKMRAYGVHRADMVVVRMRQQHGDGPAPAHAPDDQFCVRAGVGDYQLFCFRIFHKVTVRLHLAHRQAFHVDTGHPHGSFAFKKLRRL